MIRAVNPDAEIIFERDRLGRIVAETVNGRTTTFTYDLLGRRTERTTPTGLTSTWTYDPVGRPAGLHSAAGSLRFGYDAAGREIERRLGDHVTLTRTWDKTNRLTTQSLAHSAQPPSTVAGASPPAAGHLLQHRAYAYRPDDHLTEIRDLTSGTRRFTLDAIGRTTGVQAPAGQSPMPTTQPATSSKQVHLATKPLEIASSRARSSIEMAALLTHTTTRAALHARHARHARHASY